MRERCTGSDAVNVGGGDTGTILPWRALRAACRDDPAISWSAELARSLQFTQSGLRETHVNARPLFLECEKDRGVPIGPAPRHGFAHLVRAECPQPQGNVGIASQLQGEAQVLSGQLEREARLEVAA